MGALDKKRLGRIRRHEHVRKKINGTAERPRLAVFRSLSHIYVQAIDDDNAITLACASSVDKGLREELKGKTKKEIAYKVGEALAQRCKEKGLSSVVFDRGGFKYHGRVLSLADGARSGGLQF